MVGRFNVRPGDGEWVVWDNAVTGSAGAVRRKLPRTSLRGDLELQYAVHGPRDPSTVRHVSPPVSVDGVELRIGQLDAWLKEGDTWIGRVRRPAGQVSFIEQSAIRRSADSPEGHVG